MSQDDPFSPFRDDDKTIVRPTPGGRRNKAPDTVSPPTVNVASAGYALPVDERPVVGRFESGQENVLVTAAMPLLSLAGRLRGMPIHQAVEELQQRMVKEVREFETRTLQLGLTPEQGKMASYGLCSFLDEIVLNTPWGAQSSWSHHSLLVIFHKEGWGGERFFDVLQHLQRAPAQNLDLLELYYLFVTLGFQGKYRIVSGGLNALEQQRLDAFQSIQRVRGDAERELSPRWQGLRDLRPALLRYVPLWVIGAVAAAVLALGYVGFVLAINGISDPVFKQLLGLSHEDIRLAAAAAPPPPVIKKVTAPGRADRYRRLLAAEISANMVEVVDDNLLRIRNSFASGSDKIKPEFLPMIDKIAKDLVPAQDNVLVTGHTDDKPIVSARFPSNWHLSNSRAKNVADMLIADASPGLRIRAEGRADGEPLAPNDNADNRALNRRVDILIK